MAVRRKSLPTGFRYLFSRKEIKSIETELNLKFESIAFGNIIHSEKFIKDNYSQRFLHPISISARFNYNWNFSIHQTGLRNELIPNELESEIVNQVKEMTKKYLVKILNSKETDLLKNPQLWVYVKIHENKVKISSKEIR